MGDLPASTPEGKKKKNSHKEQLSPTFILIFLFPQFLQVSSVFLNKLINWPSHKQKYHTGVLQYLCWFEISGLFLNLQM